MTKKTIPILFVAMLLGMPTTLLAGDRGDAILGGALGGALGAAAGSELGGRDGAIVGGAIGGATGTAIATRRHRQSPPEVIYVDRHRRMNRPVYVEPRDGYGPPPRYYRHSGRYRDHYWRHHHHEYRHHRDWD